MNLGTEEHTPRKCPTQQACHQSLKEASSLYAEGCQIPLQKCVMQSKAKLAWYWINTSWKGTAALMCERIKFVKTVNRTLEFKAEIESIPDPWLKPTCH